jgi:hypothetical protein
VKWKMDGMESGQPMSVPEVVAEGLDGRRPASSFSVVACAHRSNQSRMNLAC